MRATKADKIAHERRREREAAQQQQQLEETRALVKEAEERVPALLAELEAQDYPDVRELQILDPGLIRTKRRRSVGGWLIAGDKLRNCDAHYSESIHLLSDGRFLIGTTLVYPGHNADLRQLRGIVSGLRALDQRLEKRRQQEVRRQPAPRRQSWAPTPSPLPPPLPPPPAPPSMP
jgi:hypothetical protein